MWVNERSTELANQTASSTLLPRTCPGEQPPPCAAIASQLSWSNNFVHHSGIRPQSRVKIEPLFHLACLQNPRPSANYCSHPVQPYLHLGFVMASTKHPRSSFGPHLRIITAIATAIVILALALGLGLGLGLKHHRHNASQASPSTQSLLFLTRQTPNNFIVGSIVSQSPQDRKYNFTLSLANGAPDGVNKTMLVVNGTSLRPCRYCRTFWAGMTYHVPSGFSLSLVVVQGGN
jgi:hypothetical protein